MPKSCPLKQARLGNPAASQHGARCPLRKGLRKRLHRLDHQGKREGKAESDRQKNPSSVRLPAGHADVGNRDGHLKDEG